MSEERMITLTKEQYYDPTGNFWCEFWHTHSFEKLPPAPPTLDGVYEHIDGQWLFICTWETLMRFKEKADRYDDLNR